MEPLSPDGLNARLAAAERDLASGNFEDAERAFAELAGHQPALTPMEVLLGLARCAAARQHWREADARWSELIERFPEHSQPDWIRQLDRCRTMNTRTRSAASSAKEAVSSAGVDLLIGLGRFEDADREIARGLEAGASAPLLVRAVRVAAAMGDLDRARRVLREAVGASRTPAELEQVFVHVPFAFEGWPRIELWLAIQKRLQVLAIERDSDSQTRATALAMRLKIALRDNIGFLSLLDRFPGAATGAWSHKFQILAARLRAERSLDFDAPKVFGIGLMKTGTTTVAQALQRLGYFTAHYRNDFTMEILRLEDAFVFDAMLDTPVCVFFESLLSLFPNARFVYTVRPFESWARSVEQHYRRTFAGAGTDEILRRGVARRGGVIHGMDRSLSFASLFLPHGDLASAWRAYDARVRRCFRDQPERLLEFDVESGDGWGKLCGFLDEAVPDELFPWENRAAGFAVAGEAGLP